MHPTLRWGTGAQGHQKGKIRDAGMYVIERRDGHLKDFLFLFVL